MQFGPEAVCSARKNRIGSEFIICRDEAYCWAQNSKFDERLLCRLLTAIGLCNAEAYVLFEGGAGILKLSKYAGSLDLSREFTIASVYVTIIE